MQGMMPMLRTNTACMATESTQWQFNATSHCVIHTRLEYSQVRFGVYLRWYKLQKQQVDVVAYNDTLREVASATKGS